MTSSLKPNQFEDVRGDVWTINVSLSKARRLARTVGIDVMNPDDYERLTQSIGARLEFVYHCCADQRGELEVTTLDAFEARLCGNEEVAWHASNALQEALIAFFRRLNLSGMADTAEVNLNFMREAYRRTQTPEAQQQMTKLKDAGQLLSELEQSQESTPSAPTDG